MPDRPLIQIVSSVAELEQCFPVIAQLRPHLDCDRFVAQVQRQQQQGYQLAYLTAGSVRAVAGFRLLEQLAHGRVLYVDDLVTDQTARSQGYGRHLFDWLVEQATAQQCDRLELDSGVQRGDAHRFYFRQRMTISSYRFTRSLKQG